MLSIILTLLSLIFISCNQRQGNKQQNSLVNDEGGSTVIDNYGREITIKNIPGKILTLGPNCSELFVALGLTEYIAGNTLDNHSRGALTEYQDAYDTIPELNYGSATREAVISSGADFIYGIDWEFGEEGLDIHELSDYGIITYVNSASTMAEIYQEITDLGKIFQIEDRAAALIASQEDRIKAVNEIVADAAPVKVLVYDSGGEGVFTCGGNNFETLLIEMAGGKNIFDDILDKQWTTVSYEEVLKREPDVILIHDYDAPSLEDKIKAIKNEPALSQLKCVKEERFVAIALESVLPGIRMAYAVEVLSEGFHPGLFQ